jgi:hypothetical protein
MSPKPGASGPGRFDHVLDAVAELGQTTSAQGADAVDKLIVRPELSSPTAREASMDGSRASGK